MIDDDYDAGTALDEELEDPVTLEHVHLGERRTVERGSPEHRALLKARNAARTQLWRELV